MAISTFGVDRGRRSCSPVTTDPAKGNGDHVGPGTNSPTTTKVKYATVPPTYGPHFAQPIVADREFYTAADSRRSRPSCTTSSTATRSSGTTRRP